MNKPAFCFKFLSLVSVVWGSLLLSSCILSDDRNISLQDASATGIVTGKVIDASTRAPIADAQVALIINGNKKTTTTSSSDDPDLTGTFRISGVPGGKHIIKFVMDGYAVVEGSIDIPMTTDNSPYTTNLGLVELGKSFDLAVLVTADAVPLEGVPVFAQPEGVGDGCSKPITDGAAVFEYSGAWHETHATTDADGMATLSGLNQCGAYSVVAPAFDADGDGIYDYVTAAAGLYDGRNSSDSTITLTLTKTQRDDAINIVDSSFDVYDKASAFIYTITDTGPTGERTLRDANFFDKPATGTAAPIRFVFNYPVSLDGSLNGGIRVYQQQLLANPDADGDDSEDIGYGVPREVNVTVSLDSIGTILTITPPEEGFVKNEPILLQGEVTAQVQSNLQHYSLASLADQAYVVDDTDTGLNASTTITADNYNGATNGPGSGTVTSGTVYLEFPEIVIGTYRVLQRTARSRNTGVGDLVYTDGAAVDACPAPLPDPGQSSCGTGAGVFYRVPLDAGDVSGANEDGDTLVLYLDVADMEGNRFTSELTLTVH
jgi:hypothetical protein